MGNICHAGAVEMRTPPPPSETQPKKPLTFGKDPNLKREDFVFSNIKNEPSSVLMKLPGTINGQQFIVEDCHDCDIFLMDNCTSVQIDECVNCRILVGPCQASLFLRNCKQCTVICAVQQFRTRDCVDVDVYLYSATGTILLSMAFYCLWNETDGMFSYIWAEPIIETSTRLRFGCFPLTYFSLQQQFDKAKFSVWNNKWSEVCSLLDWSMSSAVFVDLTQTDLHVREPISADLQFQPRPRLVEAAANAIERVFTCIRASETRQWRTRLAVEVASHDGTICWFERCS